MHRKALIPFFCLLVSALAGIRQAQAVCAEVRIVIEQHLSFERQAFEATMTITNGTEASLLNPSVQVEIRNPEGTLVHPDAFAIVSGQSSYPPIPASPSPVVYRWLIIPAADTGGTQPSGKTYYVGAKLSYTPDRPGAAEERVTVEPDYIVVLPQPKLKVDYFLQKRIEGDDPWAPHTQTPVPFPLGVRISNIGSGPARGVNLESGSPRIVANRLGFAINFYYQALEVMGIRVPLQNQAYFGEIVPGESKVAVWRMVATYDGEFLEFTANYSHAPELGGERTSLITTSAPVFVERDVLVDLPGYNDGVADFLSFDPFGATPETPAPRVYYSGGGESTALLLRSTMSGASTTASITLNPSQHLYFCALAPAALATGELAVVRSDGKLLPKANVWRSRRREGGQNVYRINFFDSNAAVTTTDYHYTFVTESRTNFAGWKQKYFGLESDPGIVGPKVDYDKDGVANLVEYALGMDPTKPFGQNLAGMAAIQYGKMTDAATGLEYMTLTYTRRTDDPLLVFNVLSSADPKGTWRIQSRETNVVPLTGHPDGAFEIVTVVDQEPLPANRYMKVEVALKSE